MRFDNHGHFKLNPRQGEVESRYKKIDLQILHFGGIHNINATTVSHQIQ